MISAKKAHNNISNNAFLSIDKIKINAKQRSKNSNFRCKRVATEVKRILSEFLLYIEGSSMITITDVEMSDDLSHAKIFIASILPEISSDDCLNFMENNKYKLRNKIGNSIRLKNIPELHFFIDDSFEKGEKIEKILKELKDKNRE